MKVYIVVTVTEGEPNIFNDIAGVYRTKTRAEEIVKDIIQLKAKDELDENGGTFNKYGINPEFDMVTYLEHTLEE